MRVFVAAETRPGERRVALVPDAVGRLSAAGLEVAVETGAGKHAFATDEAYAAAGAHIVPAALRGDQFAAADVVASVRPLDVDRIAHLKPGAVTLSFLSPTADREAISAFAERGATALSFDLVPRISRAQSMDALTSQALCAGYRAALIAAERLPKFFPLFMTAAGTIPPAKVLVLGAGVAGLQAIATARRLGAVVSAYDVRAASADEVRSMGATFVDLNLDVIEGSGGYAREMTEDRAKRQRDMLAPYIADSDALITTAAVPGRRAPLLVTRDIVEAMGPGSVVVDLASETGGNVEGSVAGDEVIIGGALVWGGQDVPSQLPTHASKLYAQNVVSLLLLSTHEGVVTPDIGDEIIDGCAVVFEGEVHHPMAREALHLPARPAPERVAEGI